MATNRTPRTTRKRGGDAAEEVPYTMRLPDGRTVFVAVPAEWCRRSADGETLFTPDAARFLDRVRALAMRTPAKPTAGYILTIREALGLTQVEFGGRVGVDSMTVSRWERGAVTPGPVALKKLEALRREAARKGVVIDTRAA